MEWSTQFRRVSRPLNTPTQKYQGIISNNFLQYPMVTHATSFFSVMNYIMHLQVISVSGLVTIPKIERGLLQKQINITQPFHLKKQFKLLQVQPSRAYTSPGHQVVNQHAFNFSRARLSPLGQATICSMPALTEAALISQS